MVEEKTLKFKGRPIWNVLRISEPIPDGLPCTAAFFRHEFKGIFLNLIDTKEVLGKYMKGEQHEHRHHMIGSL
jgi:hypothetical protein